MGIYKFRIKNKGRRCKKGASSSINPSHNKFREMAKIKASSFQKIKNSKFTKENIQRHEQLCEDKEFGNKHRKEEDELSKISDISVWTNCTNSSFDIVFRKNLLNSQIHREILALLATITEIIQSKGGIESDSEYLAAFLTTLESLQEKETITAAVYLIKLTIKKIPTSVLICKCDDICAILLKTLAKFEKDQSSSLLYNSIFVSLALILRVQPAITLLELSTLKVFHTLLAYSLDDRFKVRKMATKAIHLILFTKQTLPASEIMGSDKVLISPLIREVYEFSQANVSHCFKEYLQPNHLHTHLKSHPHDVKYDQLEKVINDALHSIVLMRDCYMRLSDQLPEPYVKSTFEMIFKLLTTIHEKNAKLVCLKSVVSMLDSSYEIINAETDVALKQAIPPIQPKGCLNKELNAKILSALYDLYERDDQGLEFIHQDVECREVWASALTDGVFSLNARDRGICGSHFVRTFQTLFRFISAADQRMADDSPLVQAANDNLKRLLNTVLPTLLQGSKVDGVENGGGGGGGRFEAPHTGESSVFGGKNILATLSKCFEKVLAQPTEHVPHLDKCLGLLATFIKVAGPSSSPFMANAIKLLAKVKDETATSSEEGDLSDSQKASLDRFMATLIAAYGPENTLNLIPLGIDPEGLTLDLKRSWILPLLRDNLGKECSLAFFESYFIPLAHKLQLKAKEHLTRGNTVLAKSMEALYSQVWSLLPGFALHSTDILPDHSSQPGCCLKRCLPQILSLLTDGTLLPTICLALRNFTKNETFTRHNCEMQPYFKQVMPALFNTFSQAYQAGTRIVKPHKLQLYETIKTCLSSCPPDMILIFFQKLREKLEVKPAEVGAFDPKYPAWLDLAAAFLPFCTGWLEGERSITATQPSDISQILNFILKFALINVGLPKPQTTISIQKKAYKILEEIFINLNESPAWRKHYFSVYHSSTLFEANPIVEIKGDLDTLDLVMSQYLTTLKDTTFPSSLSFRFRALTALAQLSLVLSSPDSVMTDDGQSSSLQSSHYGTNLIHSCSILNKSLPEAISATHGCGKKGKEAALNFIEILLSNQTSPWLIKAPDGIQPPPEYYDHVDAFMDDMVKMSTKSYPAISGSTEMDVDPQESGGEQISRGVKGKGKRPDDSPLKEVVGYLIVLNHFFVCSDSFEESHMHMSEGMKRVVLEYMIGLITSHDRVIVRHALDFLCSAMLHTPKSMAIQYSGPIAAQFGRIRRTFSKPLRFKIKIILTKLSRKGNPAAIQSFLPSELRTMYEVVQKVERRKDKKRKLKESQNASDTDSQDEYQSVPKHSASHKSNDINDVLKDMDSSSDISHNESHVYKAHTKKQSKTNVYIEEGDPTTSDGIMDLLDPSTADKIIFTKKDMQKLHSGASASTIRPAHSSFPVASDGRLVITENAVNKVSKGGGDKHFDEDLQDDFNDEEDEVTAVSGKKVHSFHNHHGVKRKTGQGNVSIKGYSDKRVKFADPSLDGEKGKVVSKKVKADKKMQPYAYYPLDKQALSKRKKAKLDSKLKGIVGSARRGALAGNKSRLKSRRQD